MLEQRTSNSGLRLAGAFLITASLFTSVGAEIASAQSPAELAREISRRDSVETQLPTGSVADESPLSRRDRSPSRDIDVDINPRLPSGFEGCRGCGSNGCAPSAPSPGATASATMIGQILAVLAIMVALFMLARFLIRRGTFQRSEEEENELVTLARSQGVDALDNAISLADWNKAVHALWLSTVLSIVEKGHRIPKAWTAREISTGLSFEGNVQGDLDRLRYLAELAQFAHHTTSEAEFLEAKALSQSLTSSIPIAPEGRQ